jgi:serine/threonine protein kinase/Tol biopolymer transport system component
VISPRDWPQVDSLFQQALARPAAERAAFIRARATNPEVVREVESLLAAHPAAAGFLSDSPLTNRVPADAPRLAPQTRLGHFEVLELIGAGGMGEVYRARDMRLERTVAIKVLSRELLAHAQGRERLEREARVVSRLSHPHICVLHDMDIALVDGRETPFLVMELVEGETLAARLRRGALPIGQAMSTGLEILQALAAAHEAGVVHRDLKPSNIMLTKAGVKLLDFGLARLERRREDERGHGAGGSEPLTREGHLLGTLPYMAPEQLRGQEADARSDLFAFGAVLYEMVTGARAFEAASDPALVAAILERDPAPIATHQPLAPPALDRILATCLAKDPNERWPRARDVLRELIWLRDDSGREAAITVARGQTTRRPWKWLTGAVIVVSGLAAWALLDPAISRPWPLLDRQVEPARPVTFSISAPKGTSFQRSTVEMALSPDGSRLVFVALSSDGTPRLWLRRFDLAEAELIAGTEKAQLPFWSPDGRWIAFFSDGELVRIDERGGARQKLADVLFARGGAWSAAGTIVFSSHNTLQRVGENGGPVTAASSLDPARSERMHAWPVFLPDGRRFLYLAVSRDQAFSGVFQGTLDSADRTLVTASTASFGATATHLLTLNNRALTARAFDQRTMTLTGESTELARGVGLDVRNSHAAVSVLGSSVLAYRMVGDQSRLTWYDRQGQMLGSVRELADYQHPWLSPDDRYIVVEKTDPTTGRHTLWKVDLARDVTSRLLDDPAGAHGPVLSADGSQIVFASNRLKGIDLFVMRADGSGTQHPVLVSPKHEALRVGDWSGDGQLLLYWTGGDLWTMPMAAPRQPRPFLQTQANELQGTFSPDMRWIAYTSDESGVPEIYVRRFPDAQSAWRVSTNGGAQPTWRRDGRELFYLAPDGRLMAATVTAPAATFETDTPRALFDTGVRGLFLERRNHYVVSRDGQRFLIVVSTEDDNVAPITVVMNWRATNPRS